MTLWHFDEGSTVESAVIGLPPITKGIQPFPASVNPRLDFRYRSNANDGNKVAALLYPDKFPP